MDYPAVLCLADVLDITVDRRLLQKLRTIESLELERLNPKDEQDGR